MFQIAGLTREQFFQEGVPFAPGGAEHLTLSDARWDAQRYDGVALIFCDGQSTSEFWVGGKQMCSPLAAWLGFNEEDLTLAGGLKKGLAWPNI